MLKSSVQMSSNKDFLPKCLFSRVVLKNFLGFFPPFLTDLKFLVNFHKLSHVVLAEKTDFVLVSLNSASMAVEISTLNSAI
jgi:hypothetical protein